MLWGKFGNKNAKLEAISCIFHTIYIPFEKYKMVNYFMRFDFYFKSK